MPMHFDLCRTLKVKIGTILENYFGRRYPTCESELPIQFGCTGSREPSGRVQGYNSGRVHWQNVGSHNILTVFKAL